MMSINLTKALNIKHDEIFVLGNYLLDPVPTKYKIIKNSVVKNADMLVYSCSFTMDSYGWKNYRGNINAFVEYAKQQGIISLLLNI